jgi:two-component system, cell cycle sensor histidine kinase and response regulator CckA
MKTRLTPVQVLLIEDNVIDARFVSADFQMRGESQFELHTAERVEDAAKILQNAHIDVILLDLFLKETQGLDTVSAVRAISPDTPVVVLSGLNDEKVALQALKHGAQDYLIKGTVDSHLMFRAIRYAIERKQNELDRRSLEARSVQMQKLEALGTLAGGVAHNFNNMMMSILGHAYFLLEANPDENSRRHAEAIRATANRASALTRQLMIFSRRGKGDMVPVDLNATIRDTEELMRSVLGPDVDLSFDLAQGSVLISADASQIQHMLMSLILNARDAIASSGEIRIRTAWLPKGEQADALIAIADNGCGMSEETRAHIFEPFFTTKGLAVAAGLGLATVYGIVDVHRGRIEVASDIGKGSVFSITFPGLGGGGAA